MKGENRERLSKLLGTVGRFRYVIVILIFGVFLMLLPTGGDDGSESVAETEPEAREEYTCGEVEEKLGEILSLIDGAGDVRVMLSVEDQGERVVASDREESSDGTGGDETKYTTVIVSTGSGTEDAVTLRVVNPSFRGAIVAAEGAGSASVRLELTEAVAAVTGLDFSEIKVVKMTGTGGQ